MTGSCNQEALKSEANILNENPLGTQPLTCVAATAQLVGQNCVKDFLNFGAELVAAYGPFSVQGEYLGAHYDRNPSLLAFFNTGGSHAPGGTSINFSGYYVYATWYLTGESRAAAYKTYPEEYAAPSTFGQIKILNPVRAGGWGAWELAARLSEINLNDGGVLFAQPLGSLPTSRAAGRPISPLASTGIQMLVSASWQTGSTCCSWRRLTIGLILAGSIRTCSNYGPRSTGKIPSQTRSLSRLHPVSLLAGCVFSDTSVDAFFETTTTVWAMASAARSWCPSFQRCSKPNPPAPREGASAAMAPANSRMSHSVRMTASPRTPRSCSSPASSCTLGPGSIFMAMPIPHSSIRAAPSNSPPSARAMSDRSNQSRAASGRISIRDRLER